MINVFDNQNGMRAAAAACFASEAKRAVEERGAFSVAFSGGSSPLGLFDLLADGSVDVDWSAAFVFQVDERAAPPDSEWSNFKTLDERLLSKTPVRRENVFRIKGETPPEKAADEYERVLRGFRAERPGDAPLFDIVVLGMGRDGHTASIFPGSLAERESERLVVAVPAPATAEPRVPRVTLAFPALNDSGKAVFLTSGRDRLEMARAIVEGRSGGGKLPPGRIKSRNDVEWFVAV